MGITIAVLVSLLVGLVFGFSLGRRQGVTAARREFLRARDRGEDLTDYF
ncbi:hypothetical protein [Actinophytocola xinjiangensis]|nr:hypothetical protein [Actinophytocola xinjiangensis]